MTVSAGSNLLKNWCNTVYGAVLGVLWLPENKQHKQGQIPEV